MTLQDYRCATREPNWRIEADDDYIIFRNRFYSDLTILIDRDAYYIEREDGTYFFDMLQVKYEIEGFENCIFRYGNYFEGKYGPSFFLTEPKYAESILIDSRYEVFVLGELSENSVLSEQERKAIKYYERFSIVFSVEGFFKYFAGARWIYLAEPCERGVNHCQRQFDGALLGFYSGS